MNYDIYQLPTGTKSFLGGSASNTAYFLSLLLPHSRFRVELVSLIGNDQIGSFVEKVLDERPFGHKFVKKWEGQTGSTTITLDSKGERTIQRRLSVISNLPQYIRDRNIFRTLHEQKLHLKGSLDVWDAVIAAENHLLSLDISGLLKNSLSPQDLSKTLQKGSTTILFGNEAEIGQLSHQLNLISNGLSYSDLSIGQQTVIARKIMQLLSSKIICIKRGENGAIAITENERISSPALRVNVIDSTGAGDAFNAGFLAGYLLGYSLNRCLELGCILGSLNCTVFGGQELVVSLKDVIAFSHITE